MSKAQQYREHARECERLLEQAQDVQARIKLRRERQEWLELAASREAVERASFAGERPLDEDMTLGALRALEAAPDRGH